MGIVRSAAASDKARPAAPGDRTMTTDPHPTPMPKSFPTLRGARALLLVLPLLAAEPLARAQDPGGPDPLDDPRLPANVAAMHADGAWTIYKKDLYRYLVRYYSGTPDAKALLPDYIERRLVEAEAQRRELHVTERGIDDWIAELDKQVRQKTGGVQTIETLVREKGMGMDDFRRRARLAILRELVARAIFCEKDSSRDPNRQLDEETVVFVINKLVQDTPMVLDGAKLPDDVYARIGPVDISEYEYGRELSFALPKTEVGRALNALILAAEVDLLLGEGSPNAEERAAQEQWFLEFERNRLRHMVPAGQAITDDMIDAVLVKRGLTRALAFSNPAFLAQARARGHFRRSLSDEDLMGWFEKNKERFSDELTVARILVAARAQKVMRAGQKVRTLEQGKALADALWLRITQGADFHQLARENSDDPDAIRLNNGIVPFDINAGTPGYQDTWAQADPLGRGNVSKPFFSAGRGYVIVKLLERHPAKGFDELEPRIRDYAGDERYYHWRSERLRAARKSGDVFEVD